MRADTGISVKTISEFGSERIVRFAFDLAIDQGPEGRHGRPQGEHHEVHRRAVPGDGAARGRRSIRRSRSRTGSSTRCACSSSSRPNASTSWCLPNFYGDVVSDVAAGSDRRARRRSRWTRGGDGGGVRGDPRHGAALGGNEPRQPGRRHVVRSHDAPPHRRGGRRRPAGGGGGRGARRRDVPHRRPPMDRRRSASRDDARRSPTRSSRGCRPDQRRHGPDRGDEAVGLCVRPRRTSPLAPRTTPATSGRSRSGRT